MLAGAQLLASEHYFAFSMNEWAIRLRLHDKVSNHFDHGAVLSLMDPKLIDFCERQLELLSLIHI